MKHIKTFAELDKELENNTQLVEDIKKDPKEALKQFIQTPLNSDKWIYRMVVGSLGFAILLVIIGVVVLALNCKSSEQGVTTILTAIASGALGALAGLLAPSPSTK